jgi:hypothetical protein
MCYCDLFDMDQHHSTRTRTNVNLRRKVAEIKCYRPFYVGYIWFAQSLRVFNRLLTILTTAIPIYDLRWVSKLY